MKDTGIKTEKTITEAMKKLEKLGFIESAVKNPGAICISYTYLFTPMNIDLVVSIMRFNDCFESSLAILILSILHRWQKSQDERISFNVSFLCELIGYSRYKANKL